MLCIFILVFIYLKYKLQHYSKLDTKIHILKIKLMDQLFVNNKLYFKQRLKMFSSNTIELPINLSYEILIMKCGCQYNIDNGMCHLNMSLQIPLKNAANLKTLCWVDSKILVLTQKSEVLHTPQEQNFFHTQFNNSNEYQSPSKRQVI